MEFEQFKKQMLAEMKERFPDMKIELHDVEKLQGLSYTGMTVRPKGEFVAATINLEMCYEWMKKGVCFERVVEEIAGDISNRSDRFPSINLEELMDYDRVKGSLIMQMVPIAGNEPMLEELPHTVIEDMATVYRLEVYKDVEHSGSTLVTDHMLQKYGISVEQLHADALEAMVQTHPASLRNTTEVLKEMMEDMAFLVPDEPSPMWVASIDTGIDGAVVIQYPGFLDAAAKTLGGDFFILPSSLHEALLMADDGSYSVEGLEEMVRSVNEMEVPPEYRLSNNVFHYDSEARIFENARTFEARTAGRDEPAQEDRHSEKDMITVLLVEPLQYPKVIEINNELDSFQSLVGGRIEATYPFEEPVGLIMNEDGKFNGLPLNRALRDEQGEIYDAVAGPFLVVGLGNENFASLTPELSKHFEEHFHQPEVFVKMSKGIVAIPISEEKVKEACKQMEDALTDKSHEEKANPKIRKAEREER